MDGPVAGGPVGRVLQVYLKGAIPDERGLPKHPVAEATITRSGVAGDFNVYRHREKADDPGMALLLMPVEMLRQLNSEGWPVRPGDLGENITSEGIPYAELGPKRAWTIGEATVEVVEACVPCDNLRRLPYVGAAREAEFLRTMLGRRGWYARVLHEGRVRPGDPIRRASVAGPASY